MKSVDLMPDFCVCVFDGVIPSPIRSHYLIQNDFFLLSFFYPFDSNISSNLQRFFLALIHSCTREKAKKKHNKQLNELQETAHSMYYSSKQQHSIHLFIVFVHYFLSLVKSYEKPSGFFFVSLIVSGDQMTECQIEKK